MRYNARMIPPLHEILELARSAAQKAGDFIVATRASGISISYKGELNLVTQADLGAEKIILDQIAARFPDHKLLSEETNFELVSAEHLRSPLWIVDPIDGTTNYAHGHLQVGVSIAFAVEGKVQVGVVYSPFQDELFSAVRGQGAKLNGEPICCSEAVSLKASLIATGFPYEREHLEDIVRRVHSVLAHCRDLRRLGAASLDISWVAAGRLDGYYESVSPWDMAAAGLIAREAGASVAHLFPPQKGSLLPEELFSDNLVVAAPGIIQDLTKLLRGG